MRNENNNMINSLQNLHEMYNRIYPDIPYPADTLKYNSNTRKVAKHGLT